MLWTAQCYNFDIMLGRVLITIPSGSAMVKTTSPTAGVINGVAAIVVSDMMAKGQNFIRKFWIYKELTPSKTALEYFLDNSTNLATGTAATPVLNSANSADGISYLCKYVTGFYGGIPNNVRPVTIQENEGDMNERNRNIKLLIKDVNSSALNLFQTEIQK